MKSVLKANSVELEFNGRKVLQDISLTCTQGEVVGLLGRNGCGKSSLLKVIFGLLKPKHKYVSINDKFIANGYDDNRIAYLPQQNYLPDSIKIQTLAKVLVDDFFWDEFTEQSVYKKYYNKPIGVLSGGELRMLEMLMVIYSKADFILLDEPFTHISPVQTEMFKPLIKASANKKGIIITDHQYYNVLDVSDRIILLQNGCTTMINDVDELVKHGYISNLNSLP